MRNGLTFPPEFDRLSMIGTQCLSPSYLFLSLPHCSLGVSPFVFSPNSSSYSFRFKFHIASHQASEANLSTSLFFNQKRIQYISAFVVFAFSTYLHLKNSFGPVADLPSAKKKTKFFFRVWLSSLFFFSVRAENSTSSHERRNGRE